MFSGATPRNTCESPRRNAVEARRPNGTAKGSLCADLERIFRDRKSGLYDALMSGVEGAALGSDRVQACEARQRDAEAVLRRLEDEVNTTGEDSAVILEEDNPRVRNGRQEVSLAWAVGCLDMFQKALAALEAHELLAWRASAGSSDEMHKHRVAAQTRLDAHENGIQPPIHRPPPGGSSNEGVQEEKRPTSYMQLHSEAAALQSRARERLQDLAGPRRPLDDWRSWFFSSICSCTARQEESDHSASVVEIVNAMHQRAMQAEKGDIMCCSPISVDLDGVRYREGPSEDGRVLKEAANRGEKVLVQRRKDDWFWNSKGYLPLRHPVDGTVLFLFDHKRSQVGDSEESSESESPSKSSASRSPRNKAKLQGKLLKPNLRGATPPVDQQSDISSSVSPATSPPRKLSAGSDQKKNIAGQPDPAADSALKTADAALERERANCRSALST